MGQLPPPARGKSNGKLTAVLDQHLRVGDEQVSETIIAAYKERGLQPPGHLEAPPSVREEFVVYWEAFQDLITERKGHREAIPVTAILAYARHYGLNADTLKRIVWKVDRVLLSYWKAQDKAEKDRAEREAKHKAALGKSK